ncbi:MAG: dihydrofolate reductase family protein [Acidimicrobiales bacterium]|nr:dihydrofolate reductase family protein [Acidimicrobiales bacterium]
MLRRAAPTTPLEAADAYADPARGPHDGRPWVLVNMVASLDGASAVAGRSGGLGGPADRAVFRALRSLADVVLVGAGTANAEGYRPARPGPDGRRPRLAVVSGRLSVDWSLPMFTDDPLPYLVTTDGAAVPNAAPVEVIRAGATGVDCSLALAALLDRGVGIVLCEGGPTLNGQLAAAGLVDEWCITVAPLVAGGDAPRVVRGPPIDPPVALRLDQVLDADGVLFLRYLAP